MSEREKKKNKSPCSSRCGLAALQRGHRHCLHRRYCFLFFGRSGLYPGGRARRALRRRGEAQEARYPAGTLGDIQAVTSLFVIVPLCCQCGTISGIVSQNRHSNRHGGTSLRAASEWPTRDGSARAAELPAIIKIFFSFFQIRKKFWTTNR